MQFVQDSLDEIIIWIDGDAPLPFDSEQQIRQEMVQVFGADMRFTVRSREVEQCGFSRI